MCGIFGAINFKKLFDKDDFEKFVGLTDMVSYRGPDDSGHVALGSNGPIRNQDGFNIFFGHRRLSIIDLTDAGHQPFTDDEGLWIIFNGEIFNYIELREELKAKGYTFRSKTDTEVILKVYKEYGEAGFKRLNGMWAFAIFDQSKRKIILSRDRFSIKPIYFTQNNGAFYFASEIKQLLPLVADKKANESVIYMFLQQGIADHNSETFFEGIFKIEPKTNMIIDVETGKCEMLKYWDYEIEEIPNMNYASEKFRELFLDSVKIRLRSDVKIGSLLSGGLDSSIISLFADYLQNGNFESFSVIARDKKYSEERFIDALISEKGIRNTKLYFDADIALKSLNDVVYHNDEPVGGLSVVAQYAILEKLKKESDITVVLSGQGGDETLMGYLKYFFFNLGELIKKGAVHSALNQVFLSLLNRTVLWQFRLKEAKRYIPIIDFSKKPFLKAKGNIEFIGLSGSLRERQMLDIDKYSVPVLAHYEDRNSMAHALEIRLPFLDHRLVNFLISLPSEYKIKNGWTKYILRKAITELPERIRWRRDKQGFLTSEEKWLKDDLKGMIEKAFANSVLDRMGFIDGKLFLNYYRKFQNNKGNILYSDISRVFLAELWAKTFFNCDDSARGPAYE